MRSKRPKARATPSEVDRDRLRAALRKVPEDYLVKILHRAIDHLPDERLPELFAGFVPAADLRPQAHEPRGLIELVRAFHAASLGGDYYEEFDVNWKNCTRTSRGTQIWFAECERLVDLIVADAKAGNVETAVEAFELIFDLLRKIDSGDFEIVFFADEGGSWQVGIDWRNVLPVWFKCLAATVTPERYGHDVVAVIDKFARYDRDKHLEAARRAAKGEQKTALDAAAAACRR